MDAYTLKADRYENLSEGWFRRCGRSGLVLPAISLGIWQNFGDPGTGTGHHQDEKAFHENSKQMIFTAFDCGITHIDAANIYGPPKGKAEERLGQIIKQLPRNELVVSTKAGVNMWPGPYGRAGSRKHILTSLDESLKRLDLDFVDIYYHHCPDPDAPLEETLGAYDQAVRSGKALHFGVSNYSGALTAEAIRIIDRDRLAPLLVHQPSYSMLNRGIETDLFKTARHAGFGMACFSPLGKGRLSSRFLGESKGPSRVDPATIDEPMRTKLGRLNDHAVQRGQSLPQMALAWVLRNPCVTTALIGASRPEQIRENAAVLDHADFTEDELQQIDKILAS